MLEAREEHITTEELASSSELAHVVGNDHWACAYHTIMKKNGIPPMVIEFSYHIGNSPP